METDAPQEIPDSEELIDWNTPQPTNSADEQERQQITTAPAYHSDKRFYQTVVWFLGLTMLTCTIGAILLASFSKDIPDIIVAIGSAAIGALAGLFAPSQR